MKLHGDCCVLLILQEGADLDFGCCASSLFWIGHYWCEMYCVFPKENLSKFRNLNRKAHVAKTCVSKTASLRYCRSPFKYRKDNALLGFAFLTMVPLRPHTGFLLQYWALGGHLHSSFNTQYHIGIEGLRLFKWTRLCFIRIFSWPKQSKQNAAYYRHDRRSHGHIRHGRLRLAFHRVNVPTGKDSLERIL